MLTLAVCPQELAGSHSREQVAWALSLVHSRSFVQSGRHVWVPGIDMCNHTLAPNADIRRAGSRQQGGQAVLGGSPQLAQVKPSR